VYGFGTDTHGVLGVSQSAYGVLGNSTNGVALGGNSSYIGLFGSGNGGATGVQGTSQNGTALYAHRTARKARAATGRRPTATRRGSRGPCSSTAR
jgi:hypothetical protein